MFFTPRCCIPFSISTCRTTIGIETRKNSLELKQTCSSFKKFFFFLHHKENNFAKRSFVRYSVWHFIIIEIFARIFHSPQVCYKVFLNKLEDTLRWKWRRTNIFIHKFTRLPDNFLIAFKIQNETKQNEQWETSVSKARAGNRLESWQQIFCMYLERVITCGMFRSLFPHVNIWSCIKNIIIRFVGKTNEM